MKRRRFKKLSDYGSKPAYFRTNVPVDYGRGAPRKWFSIRDPIPKREYLAYALVAAGIFLLAFSNAHLTGFVIANQTIDSAYPVAAGFILLIIALLLSKIKRDKK